MLPNLEMVEANINHSFHINHIKAACFPSLRHFHPEVEILLVIQGRGTRFVGDSVEMFAPGDLVMIGPNVPHEWQSDRKDSESIAEAVYILFNPEILGKQFWNLPESKIILKIIQQSGRGIKLTGKTRTEVEELLRSVENSYGFTRMILLMSILEKIAFNGEFQYLASPVINNTVNEDDNQRLRKIYRYVLDNMHHNISLEKAASVANLSTAAFCRYFKRRTNKTFIAFLNEIRIGQACRYLINENNSVEEICFLCGYNNISYFIRQFRKITGLTPSGYRRKFADRK